MVSERGEYRVMTRGFRHAIDANLSAAAAMIAYSLASGSNPAQFIHVDWAVSILLALSGIVAGLPSWLIIASSVPGVVIDQAFTQSHVFIYMLVAMRIWRVLWNLNWFASQASKIGKEITVFATQATLMAIVILFGGAISLYVVEKDAPGSMIHSFWDALWASIVTTTTVGYGDITPVTSAGRLVTSLMMIFGVGLIMFLLSQMAWIIARMTAQEELDAHLPPLDREKIKLLRILEEIEFLDDDEFLMVMHRLNTIRLLKRLGSQGPKTPIDTLDQDEEVKVTISPSAKDTN
ncbi:MAG: ion channel [Desulfurococcales archaeon]|nr:ion channel [Desulfurococcales archaeon]